ncbi:hypothetical protein [Flexibacterium corallicola]|uniref:hypothetical protein n=1 Tax=Flexibacterium corallicola TaxID=3037259 RepID=UPI00286F0BE1|nr:hypothetical protein [Pseudovibrio sp. M1P-2-3]
MLESIITRAIAIVFTLFLCVGIFFIFGAIASLIVTIAFFAVLAVLFGAIFGKRGNDRPTVRYYRK